MRQPFPKSTVQEMPVLSVCATKQTTEIPIKPAFSSLAISRSADSIDLSSLVVSGGRFHRRGWSKCLQLRDFPTSQGKDGQVRTSQVSPLLTFPTPFREGEGVGETPKNESPAIAPTTAEPKLDEATKPQYGADPAPIKVMTLADLQAAVEHELDDKRAVEMVSDALMSNPLELMLAVMDSEIAEDARAALWEKAFAEFARSERIDSSTSFKYAKLSRAQPCEFERDRKLLAERPWVDFGRNWVYTVQRMRGDPTLWVPQGREYRPVGCDQFSGGPYPYEAEASSL